MRILKFTASVDVGDLSGTKYEEGQQVDFKADSSAERWLRRGVAVEITVDDKKVTEKKPSRTTKVESKPLDKEA